MTLFRRSFVAAAALLAAGAVSLRPEPARAQVNVGELMAPGPLPDRSVGDPKAPVSIIEYASMTCPHCADFEINTFPTLKQRYIDAGKVYYVLREFPLDDLAKAAFMLARCVAGDQMTLKREPAGEDGDKPASPPVDPRTETPLMPQNEQQANERYYALVDVLFRQQRTWAYSKEPAKALFDIAKQAGFTQQSFEACLSDQALLDAIDEIKDRGAQKFNVNSTPTFFINGKVVRGTIPANKLDEALQPHLKR
jgi:protein-disulfide isomerase